MEDGNNCNVVQSKPFQIFARLPDGRTSVLQFAAPRVSGEAIKQRILEIASIPTQSQRLICGGTQLGQGSVVSSSECTVHVLLRLIGGKGGFGSLLRGAATKAGQKKTNNFDACRDMSGRRLRHVNAEKRLEEWKAEEENRRLEKVAEEFIKKKAKKGKKGAGNSQAEKYVEKYREESAKCAAKVEEAVREACGNGNVNGKRKGKAPIDGAEAKRLKIWMGKKKLAGSDSESMDEDSSDDEENEKSVVLNNGNHSDPNKEAEGSLDSVTGSKRDGECSDGTSHGTSSEEVEIVVKRSLKSGTSEEVSPNEDDGLVEPEVQNQIVAPNGTSEENVGPDYEQVVVSSSGNGQVAERRPAIAEANSFSDTKSESKQDTTSITNVDLEKPLNFDAFNSAEELEVLGMERLKIELQVHGLKCGGTLQERAARLFLLKSTPSEKLPKKLLAKK
uniref:Uncharacterized protein MANES_05G023500 n=1 Tax=Rhizophora mucronata TaxID=61149 RepID=A0A2P2J4Y9_RHIMU